MFFSLFSYKTKLIYIHMMDAGSTWQIMTLFFMEGKGIYNSRKNVFGWDPTFPKRFNPKPQHWLMGCQWQPNQCLSPPVSLLLSSLLLLSASSSNFWTAFLLSWPLTPNLVSKFHTVHAGNPVLPTSSRKNQVCNPLALQLLTSCWYLLFFFSFCSLFAALLLWYNQFD